MNVKKLIALGLVVTFSTQLILLTSCSKENNNDTLKNTTESTNEILSQSNNKWQYSLTDYNINIPYNIPEIKPKLEQYSVKPDLSNVFNISEYTGFTDEQKKLLSERGFIITEPYNKYLKMHNEYEMLEYSKTPMFITTDIMLYMYHIFYNNSLMSLEANSLNNNLYIMTDDLYKESLKYYNDDKYKDLKEELKYICAYFLVASKLMYTESSGEEIPPEILELADKELKLINGASEIANSPIFNYDIDYSQYKVRGHYTVADELESYFKTMMWYGNSGFPLLNQDESLNSNSTIKAMIITSIILNNENCLKLWDNLYSTTSMYSGTSDDLNIINYKELITNVYGSNPDINVFKDSKYYDKLLNEANKLPKPQIAAKLITSNVPVNKQFRLMGQRYTFDADIMQTLIEPIIRPVPSGLDIMATFGNERAEELLDEYYEPKKLWPDYEKNLDELKQKSNAITENTWKSNLYNGWLWSIKSASTSFENNNNVPMFMKNKYWTYKNINTALGSYAELKHDNVLYSKQAVAERGGSEDMIPYHYVEPNIELYSKLLWLTKNTRDNLKERQLIDEDTETILNNMEDMIQTVLKVSVKELNGEIVTEEEFQKLSALGGTIDYMEISLNMAITEKLDKPLDNYTSALISDVATIGQDKGSYLEIGTGIPYDIYVVCNQNGKTFLAKGTVYNYYEFLSDERLTNEQWHGLLGINKKTEEYGDYILIEEPSDNLPAKPLWTDLIISKNNDIKINSMGLNWNE